MTTRRTPSDDVIAALRSEISAADRELINAINWRIRAVIALHEYKRRRGIALLDAKREAQVISDMHSANRCPFSSAGVEEFGSFVLALTKREITRDQA